MKLRLMPGILLTVLMSVGCGGTPDYASTTSRLEEVRTTWATPTDDAPPPDFSGDLETYVDYALRENPSLRADYEAWRAATLRIESASNFPEPTLSYGYFIRNVETRVGPQRHRFGIRQPIPWLSRLDASEEVVGAHAEMLQRRFERRMLTIRRKIADAYWRLWMTRRVRHWQSEQLNIVGSLLDSVRGRLEVGKASLADAGQIEVVISRLTDRLDALDEKAEQIRARLVESTGAPWNVDTPVTSSPPAATLPTESVEELVEAAEEHPQILALHAQFRQKGWEAERASLQGFPDFGVGVDYIETGEATMSGVAESGKDPIIAMLSVKIPLWRGDYASAEDAARAEQKSIEARIEAARDGQAARVRSLMSKIRDAHRKIEVYDDTLIPQAEAVYGSVRGAYEVGRGNIAAILIAQRELLELRVELARARAEHALAWARLEEVVGRPIASKENGR